MKFNLGCLRHHPRNLQVQAFDKHVLQRQYCCGMHNKVSDYPFVVSYILHNLQSNLSIWKQNAIYQIKYKQTDTNSIFSFYILFGIGAISYTTTNVLTETNQDITDVQYELNSTYQTTTKLNNDNHAVTQPNDQSNNHTTTQSNNSTVVTQQSNTENATSLQTSGTTSSTCVYDIKRLRQAAIRGELYILQKANLLEGIHTNFSSDKRTILMLAARHDHAHILNYFFKTNCSCEKHTDILNKISFKCFQCINIDRKDKHGFTALAYAAWKGHERIVKQLLHRGANPRVIDRYGLTPFHKAVAFGHTNVVKQMLQHERDYQLNIMKQRADIPTASSKQLLNAHLSASTVPTPIFIHSHAKLTELRTNSYIARYHNDTADANIPGGDTSLFLAVRSSRLSMVQLLLEFGADINASNSMGQTPLHEAAASGNIQLVHLLLTYGADAMKMDKNGFLPVDLAPFSLRLLMFSPRTLTKHLQSIRTRLLSTGPQSYPDPYRFIEQHIPVDHGSLFESQQHSSRPASIGEECSMYMNNGNDASTFHTNETYQTNRMNHWMRGVNTIHGYGAGICGFMSRYISHDVWNTINDVRKRIQQE